MFSTSQWIQIFPKDILDSRTEKEQLSKMNRQRRCGTYKQQNINHKKNEIRPFAAAWMDLEIISLNEVRQTAKRQIPQDITYMRNLTT